MYIHQSGNIHFKNISIYLCKLQTGFVVCCNHSKKPRQMVKSRLKNQNRHETIVWKSLVIDRWLLDLFFVWWLYITSPKYQATVISNLPVHHIHRNTVDLHILRFMSESNSIYYTCRNQIGYRHQKSPPSCHIKISTLILLLF